MENDEISIKDALQLVTNPKVQRNRDEVLVQNLANTMLTSTKTML